MQYRVAFAAFVLVGRIILLQRVLRTRGTLNEYKSVQYWLDGCQIDIAKHQSCVGQVIKIINRHHN